MEEHWGHEGLLWPWKDWSQGEVGSGLELRSGDERGHGICSVCHTDHEVATGKSMTECMATLRPSSTCSSPLLPHRHPPPPPTPPSALLPQRTKGSYSLLLGSTLCPHSYVLPLCPCWMAINTVTTLELCSVSGKTWPFIHEKRIKLIYFCLV